MSITRWAVAALLTLTFGAVPVVAQAAPAKPADTTKPAASRPHSLLPDQQWVAGKFVPVKPTRLLDTRDGTGNHGFTAPLGPDSSLPLDVSAITGNPSVTPTAVVLNVTVTNGTADSFVSVSTGNRAPSVSSVNFQAGQTLPNLVTAPLSGDNTVYLFNHSGTVDVIADVFGYCTVDQPGSTLSTLPPTRILDTRDGIGAVGAGGTLPLTVAGRNSVPANGVTAVQLNVTVTNPTANSFLSVFPSGGELPNVSNLNFGPGQTIANSVMVPVGPDGKIDFFNHIGSVDVVADISGYYTANAPGTLAHGGIYDTFGPTRLLDTRSDGGPLGTGQSRALTVGDLNGMQGGTPTAVVLNVTVTNPTGDSFVSAYPDGSPVPASSNIDFGPGQTLSNLVVVPVGPDGKVAFFNHIGDVDLVVDMFGYYMAGADLGIESLGFAQTTVDATVGPNNVEVDWTVTDSNANAADLSGDIVLRRTGSQPNAYVGQQIEESFGQGECCGSATFVSGDDHRASYKYTLYVPPVSDSTTTHWVVALMQLRDVEGNHLLATGSDLGGYPAAALTATTNVGSNAPTYQPIRYRNFADTPPYLYDGATNSAVYEVDVQDQTENFWRGAITVSGPGGQTLTSTFEQHGQSNGQYLSYPCQDFGGQDNCSVAVVFPRCAAPGKWVVSRLVLTSNAGTTAVYDNLNTAPIAVGDNNSFNATGFSIMPTSVNDWRVDVPLTVSMRVNGARQGVSAISVDANLNSDHCPSLSNTPTANPDGSYSITIRMNRLSLECGVSGIAVVDGAGDIALYGQDYSAPDPGLVANQTPDTTPPSVSSATVSPSTFPASQVPNFITATVHAVNGIAPITSFDSYVYDSAGDNVGQEGGGTSQFADGTVSVGVYVNRPVQPGTYTIGFRLCDAGRLCTSYGMPGTNPMPGGPLTLTVS